MADSQASAAGGRPPGAEAATWRSGAKERFAVVAPTDGGSGEGEEGEVGRRGPDDEVALCLDFVFSVGGRAGARADDASQEPDRVVGIGRSRERGDGVGTARERIVDSGVHRGDDGRGRGLARGRGGRGAVWPGPRIGGRGEGAGRCRRISGGGGGGGGRRPRIRSAEGGGRGPPPRAQRRPTPCDHPWQNRSGCVQASYSARSEISSESELLNPELLSQKSVWPRSGAATKVAVGAAACSSSTTSVLPVGRSTGAGTISVCCGPRDQ